MPCSETNNVLPKSEYENSCADVAVEVLLNDLY